MYRVLSCSCSYEMMILFADNCSQETYLRLINFGRISGHNYFYESRQAEWIKMHLQCLPIFFSGACYVDGPFTKYCVYGYMYLDAYFHMI